jgi:hypothetical protein
MVCKRGAKAEQAGARSNLERDLPRRRRNIYMRRGMNAGKYVGVNLRGVTQRQHVACSGSCATAAAARRLQLLMRDGGGTHQAQRRELQVRREQA